MNLYEKIISIYPDLTSEDFATVIELQDDGNGAYIKRWEHPTYAQPTEAQLASI